MKKNFFGIDSSNIGAFLLNVGDADAFMIELNHDYIKRILVDSTLVDEKHYDRVTSLSFEERSLGSVLERSPLHRELASPILNADRAEEIKTEMRKGVYDGSLSPFGPYSDEVEELREARRDVASLGITAPERELIDFVINKIHEFEDRLYKVVSEVDASNFDHGAFFEQQVPKEIQDRIQSGKPAGETLARMGEIISEERIRGIEPAEAGPDLYKKGDKTATLENIRDGLELFSDLSVFLEKEIPVRAKHLLGQEKTGQYQKILETNKAPLREFVLAHTKPYHEREIREPNGQRNFEPNNKR